IADGIDVLSLRITPAPIGSRVFSIRRHADLELHGCTVTRIENRFFFFDDGATPSFRQLQANRLRGDGNFPAIVEMRSERKLLSRSRQGERLFHAREIRWSRRWPRHIGGSIKIHSQGFVGSQLKLLALGAQRWKQL